MRKSGNAFLEYAIVLGTCLGVILGMSAYVKRGLQGRIKDMTDFFISAEQVSQVKGITNSLSNTVSGSGFFAQTLNGGATRLFVGETKDIILASRAEDEKSDGSLPFVPAEEGNVAAPIRGNETNQPNPDLPAEVEAMLQEAERVRLSNERQMILNTIRNLALEKTKVLNEADRMDLEANNLEGEGQKAIRDGTNIDCRGRRGRGWDASCGANRDRLIRNGQEMINNAGTLRAKANDLRFAAGRLQEKIDELEQRIVEIDNEVANLG